MNHIEIKKPDDTIVFFTRHAQSIANVSNYIGIDAPLTLTGRQQAHLLNGHYDLIVISPLRRCVETLLYSGITYGKIIVNNNIREIINATGNILPNEEYTGCESDHEFFARVEQFTKDLEEYCKTYKKILIVSHAYFFNSWYVGGCAPTPPNATIVQLFL